MNVPPIGWLGLLAAAAVLLLWSRRSRAGGPEGDRIVTDQAGRDVPRGIRNNNPGNLRPSSSYKWLGQAGVDEGNYLIFDTPDNGLRAAAKNLLNQQRKHGLRTVRDIITKYAPAADNNDTQAYILAVSDELGVAATDPLDLGQSDQLAAFLRAVIRHENGVQPYSDAQLRTAAAKAGT